MQTNLNVDDLIRQITEATRTFEEKRKDYEKKLEEYKICRVNIKNEVNSWSQISDNEVVIEEILDEQEQHKQSVKYIFLKRVVQGRDWDYGRADKKDIKGVVLGVRLDGSITVRWDDGGKTKCNWGKNGKFDVKVVPFDLDMTPVSPSEQLKKPASWLVGRKVKRGRNWKWSDQDGGEGKTGSVLSVTGNGWVCVKWEFGVTNQYRWGDSDCYDVEAVF